MYRMLAFIAVAVCVSVPAAAQSQTRTVTVDGRQIAVQIRQPTRDPGLSRDELVEAARNSVPQLPVARDPQTPPDNTPR